MLLTHSAFLQSLGHALADSLWQVAALWLLCTGMSKLFRLSAAARYRLATASQLIGLVAFAITWFIRLQQNDRPVYAVAAPASFLSATNDFFNNLLPYFSLVYLPVLAWLCFRWIISFRETQVLRTDGLHKMPVEWRLFVQQRALQLGIKKEIRIFLSDKIITPMTIGFLKPLVLIPVASLNHLSTAQMEAVLLHELAHIQRYDYITNILTSIAKLVLFFNPFARLLAAIIETEREHACDDQVMQFRYDATDYASALLRIAQLQPAPAFAMPAVSGKKKELLNRIQRITGTRKTKTSFKHSLPSSLLIAASVLLAIIVMPLSNKRLLSPGAYLQMIGATTKPADFSDLRLIPAKYMEPVSPKVRSTDIITHKKPVVTAMIIPTIPRHLHKQPLAVMIAPPAQAQVLVAAMSSTDNTIALHADNFDNTQMRLNELKNIDLEKLVSRTLAAVQFTDDEKRELGTIRELLISDNDKILLRKALTEKKVNSAPVMINISFPLTETSDEEAEQMAKIKLAFLKRLNAVMMTRMKNATQDIVVIREQ